MNVDGGRIGQEEARAMLGTAWIVDGGRIEHEARAMLGELEELLASGACACEHT